MTLLEVYVQCYLQDSSCEVREDDIFFAETCISTNVTLSRMNSQKLIETNETHRSHDRLSACFMRRGVSISLTMINSMERPTRRTHSSNVEGVGTPRTDGPMCSFLGAEDLGDLL